MVRGKRITCKFHWLVRTHEAHLEKVELPNVLNTILNHMDELDNTSHVLENVVRGSLSANIKQRFGGKLVLPLNSFADSFEPSNPLGSRAGAHAMTGVYFHLLCVPPHCRGLLDNIFVAALFYSNDKYYGTYDVFRPDLNKLHQLEDEGIESNVRSEKKQISFAMVTLTGDNLGVHEALGLTCGFRGDHVFRVCTVHRDVMQIQTTPNHELLRTKASHEVDLSIYQM